MKDIDVEMVVVVSFNFLNMRQSKVLIIDSDNSNNKSGYIVSLSKTDEDNLRLLLQYLPSRLFYYTIDRKFTEQEKEAILKYNNFISSLKEKSKSSAIQVDYCLEKIKF